MAKVVLGSSKMADTLIPSEIIKLANEIQLKMQSGEQVFNLTIGDFDPRIFPLPELLTKLIIQAYADHQTNYPTANGMADLRSNLSRHISERLNLAYKPEDILVASGARPLIYAVYKTLLDPGDKVIYPVPSWNNNHYCHLSECNPIEIEVDSEQNFMPHARDIASHLEDATLIALCSPQNPTGTVFSKEALYSICKLVLLENKRRAGHQKPLYIMYDQIYWELCMDGVQHEHPVQLEPGLRDYVISIDGMSKSFAATGIRVGWAFGPKDLMAKMRAILSHIGAWAPKPEQVATALFLNEKNAIQDYLNWFKSEIEFRLTSLYEGLTALRNSGYPIEVIRPQAAIYLTVKIPWKGRKTNQRVLHSQKEVTEYLLNFCKVGFVPFKAFGSSGDSEWYRISVGTLRRDDIPLILNALKNGMDEFTES
ncbi:MAG: pyridoxal phosphate-dependent aminotransferase [Saprospiraceae bacterium]|nr:pyridoxal phosphate-dependent aminotransferase [Saprospiraceae bacterium]